MDDWNDFGPPVTSTNNSPAVNPASDSSPSSFASISDSSAALLPSPSSRSRQSSSYTNPRTDSSEDHNLYEAGSREREQSSFLSSIPFIGPSAARLLRDRHEAAAAAAAAEAAAAAAATEAASSNHISKDADAVAPAQRVSIADRTLDSVDDGDGISAASGSDAAEPKSHMMPRTTAEKREDLDVDGAHAEYAHGGRAARRGELDDVPDDFELNRAGLRCTDIKHLEKKGKRSFAGRRNDFDDSEPISSVIASSLLKHKQRSYIKLEVISAKQIKNLIMFFNVFIVLAIIWTIITIILGNTVFLKTQELPIPTSLLYDHQKTNKTGVVPTTKPDGNSVRGRAGTGPAKCAAHSCFAEFVIEYLHKKGKQYTRDGLEDESEFSSSADAATTRQSSVATVQALSGRASASLFSVSSFRVSLGGVEQRDIAPLLRLPQDEFIEFNIVDVPTSTPPKAYKAISHFTTLIMSLFFFVMAILFGTRIFRQGRRHISHEQVWVFILIICTFLYFNPLFSVLRITEELTPSDLVPLSGPIGTLDEWLIVIRDIFFTVFSFFYVWVSLHSYRILDPTKRLGFREFYVPKLIVLLPYMIFKFLAHALLRLQLSEVPMLSGPAMVFIFGQYNFWNYLKAEFAYCIAATIIEGVLIVLIVFEAFRTTNKLQKAPYMKHRTKRVGFRFFLYINFLFYPLYIALNCMLMFGLPKGDKILQIIISIDFPRADVLFFYTVGPCLLISGYVTATAYVHLPCTSVGVIKGWFKSSELAKSGSRWSYKVGESISSAPPSGSNIPPSSNIEDSENVEKKTIIRVKDGTWTNDEATPRSVVDNDDELERQIVEPITYKKRESHDSLELKANCFTMQTHVIMFNFAWYVYYYGTPKLETFKSTATDHVRDNPLPFDYKIAKHVKSEKTDTQALVVDCSDRIIITFKGTTSMRNLRTSLQMNHERLSSVVRTSVSGEDEFARLKRLFGRRYLSGKIHKGFAEAYMSVADKIMEQVRVLRERKQRPVFLTGHSLGGALATICSLDLWVSLDISRREIFVSTFGSPRVGNKDFANVYKEVVPLHWRIVVDPDMIAKLPNVGYKHVGKKVVLTPHGDMFIDPSALEARPWTGESAVFAYHRKASYMLAMRAWCVRHHGMTYTPAFWPFPIRQEDERRFPGVVEEEVVSERMRKGKVTSKIIHMDAMVDALGRGDIELANMAAVEKWARLTRRLLLQDKLVHRA